MAGQLGTQRARAIIVLLAGLVLGQALLYGPSLIGRKILLPLDLLAQPATYLPRSSDFTNIEPQNPTLSDKLTLFEPARRFAAAEFRAGRLPMWAPYQFGGVPFIWPKFSPFLALSACTLSPVAIAWAQLLQALVAGVGMYLFCRVALSLSYWPATLVAWCYPLTAFFVLWQGYPTSMSVAWLPWVLLMLDVTVKGTHGLAMLGLAVVTCLLLVSGHLDVAGQVLLIAGCFAFFLLIERFRSKPLRRLAGLATLKVALGFCLGLLLAAPYVLPVLDYTRTGARMSRRNAGEMERPPIGLAALPELVLPYIYGSTQTGSIRTNGQTEAETAAAGYIGLVATVLLAPLAACSRRHRALNLFWVCLSFLGLAWSLNVPGIVSVLKLPPLNLMSHNRLVFATAFALLALTAVGLEVLWQGEVKLRRWWLVPAGVAALLYAWCAYRSLYLPDIIGKELEDQVNQGPQLGWLHDLAGVHRVQDWFGQHYAVAAGLSAAALAGWVLLRWRSAWQTRAVPALGSLLVLELLWFGWGRIVQCDPALYFPRLPALAQTASAEPGRVLGWRCLPASVASMAGLSDVRGYDGVDPQRMVELVSRASDGWFGGYPYALTQWLAPRLSITPDGELRLPPLLDLLGVRYVIFRQPPPDHAPILFHSQDYWVLLNKSALPRVFVPRRVDCIPEPHAQLDQVSASQFSPHEVAFVETLQKLPESCRGSAELERETPTRAELRLQMETDGLVVLADNWDAGWRATLDGQTVPVLRVDYALRGVVVPAGAHHVEFRYEPASFRLGLAMAAAGLGGVLGWALVLKFRARPL